MSSPTTAIVHRTNQEINPEAPVFEIAKNYRGIIEGRYKSMKGIWHSLRQHAASCDLSCEIGMRYSADQVSALAAIPATPLNPGFPPHHQAILRIHVAPIKERDESDNIYDGSEYRDPDDRLDNMLLCIAANGQHGLLQDLMLGCLAIVQMMENRSNFSRFLPINIY